jgi:hypothetical protein
VDIFNIEVLVKMPLEILDYYGFWEWIFLGRPHLLCDCYSGGDHLQIPSRAKTVPWLKWVRLCALESATLRQHRYSWGNSGGYMCVVFELDVCRLIQCYGV